ncbi:MAG: hypothetical protein ACE5NW_07490 [Acidiferrobacterales bacterium]
MKTTDYVPLACTLYDRYEVAIVHRRRLQLVWRVGNIAYRRAVKPLNLQRQNGEEFLICRTGGDALFSIRLDRISRAEVV